MNGPETASARPSHSALIAEVRAGRRRSVSRLMSLAESTGAAGKAAIAEVHRHTGRAHVVGLTGVPGSGKSTMVRALAQKIRASGRTVGIVAVDPSSPFSGGAILGDRIRMLDLAGDPGVFIRSMATRGALGGLARASLDVVDVLDAAGFEVVLIETVGVGQDEVDIVQAAHTVVVVSAPGLGDEIQAIKAGVLEIADVHVVSKCDRAESSETVADLRAMLRLGSLSHERHSGWDVPVVATSAQKREGIDALLEAIDRHRGHLLSSGELAARHRRILEMRILKAAEDIVRDRLLRQYRSSLDRLLDNTAERVIDPHSAALRLLRIAEGVGADNSDGSRVDLPRHAAPVT
ncbi:MAG: methylmalonyl Co-A mutase-associated GTPase MeaB [Rhodospirillales bacterium]|nr:methylmalonyl Co-A mutase-associated GTPase MeaB [Rhodospirillales bacterium]